VPEPFYGYPNGCLKVIPSRRQKLPTSCATFWLLALQKDDFIRQHSPSTGALDSLFIGVG